MSVSEIASKLGIIAGRGMLPRHVREACLKSGRACFLLAIEGEADAAVSAVADATVPLGAIGRTLSLLKNAGCKEVVLAGHVRRPDFRALSLDLRGARLLPKVIAAARKGDDALLRVLGATLEAEGFRLVGVRDVATDLLAPRGPLGSQGPSARDRADIAKGVNVLRALGPFDIGQAIVVCDGLVLAIEAAGGTNLMLEHCAALPEALRGTARARRGVLVKLPKHGQEMRLDLPAIGPETVENAAQAGLAGIAVGAGVALLLDRPAIIKSADNSGLFVVGLGEDEWREGAAP